MKVALVSDDKLIEEIVIAAIENQYDFIQYRGCSEPIDVISGVCISNPRTIIIDDDFLKPNSAQVLNSIKLILPESKLIFLTSNSSIGLGREISQLGIHYYGIKPLSEPELKNLFESMNVDTSVN